ncbi:MAG: hypothetical protein LBV41_06530, partial [Cytophagaceae bacterium]|nr:hypothetical protein [Cytophagaceae bacterium]
MNKLYFPIIILLLLVLSARAQEPKESWTLSSPESGNKNYVARDGITLKPGFSYKAAEGSSNTFRASVDPALLFPPTDGTYMKPNGTLTSNPLEGYAVGAIPGQFNVSPSGAATYSIPIEVPSGVNGMQPNISLVYNSQAGNGIAGWGWNIGGLSMISRMPANIYYDNKASGIDWTKSSPLALDGQHLIPIGNNEYRTENESYSKITGKNI